MRYHAPFRYGEIVWITERGRKSDSRSNSPKSDETYKISYGDCRLRQRQKGSHGRRRFHRAAHSPNVCYVVCVILAGQIGASLPSVPVVPFPALRIERVHGCFVGVGRVGRRPGGGGRHVAAAIGTFSNDKRGEMERKTAKKERMGTTDKSHGKWTALLSPSCQGASQSVKPPLPPSPSVRN